MNLEEPRTVSGHVYSEIRDKILSGEFGAGMRLVQRKLASDLGVSSVPVAEALRRLESEGLVICHAGLGAQVKTWTPDDVTSMYYLREYMEAATTRLFSEKASRVERLTLKELGERYDAACLVEGDPMALIRADTDLHLYLAKHARSPTLIQFVENLCIVTIAMKQTTWRSMKKESDPWGEPAIHNALIAAVMKGDPDEVERAARSHIRDAVAGFLRYVKSNAVTSKSVRGFDAQHLLAAAGARERRGPFPVPTRGPDINGEVKP